MLKPCSRSRIVLEISLPCSVVIVFYQMFYASFSREAAGSRERHAWPPQSLYFVKVFMLNRCSRSRFLVEISFPCWAGIVFLGQFLFRFWRPLFPKKLQDKMQSRYIIQIWNKDIQYRDAIHICNTNTIKICNTAVRGSDATVCNKYIKLMYVIKKHAIKIFNLAM